MVELSTEQKIITAARIIFSRKGFAATRTRDIAHEAGINLALLNYYFGSKKNLFKMIVREKFQLLLVNMIPTLSDEQISLKEKIGILSENYTNMLLENEELPIFVLNEMSVNREFFADLLSGARTISQPIIEKQLKEIENQLMERGLTISVTDLIINVFSLIIFPFVAKPLLISSGLLTEENFKAFVTERKGKIMEWII